MPSNEARRNLLSNERLDTFQDALWLELWPFLCFMAESRRIAWETQATGQTCVKHSRFMHILQGWAGMCSIWDYLEYDRALEQMNFFAGTPVMY